MRNALSAEAASSLLFTRAAMAEEQAHVAMSQAEAEVEQAAPDDLPPPSEPPPPWAELPAPALDATLAALGLQDRCRVATQPCCRPPPPRMACAASDGMHYRTSRHLPSPASRRVCPSTIRRLSASAACKSWLDASSVSAALWGTLMLDEESGVGGNSKPVLFPGLVNLLKTLKSGGDDSPPPPPAAEPQPEGTVAWFRRRAGAIRSLTVSTWDEQCAEQLAPLVPLALRGLAAADDSSAGAGSGGGGAAHGGPRPGLRELTISLEGSMPLDDCPDLLAGCSGLRRLTLTTASLQVMSSLPTSLSTLNLTLQLPTDGRMPLQEYLSIVVEAAEPLGRWEWGVGCHPSSRNTQHGAAQQPLSSHAWALLHFAPSFCTRLAVLRLEQSMNDWPQRMQPPLEGVDKIHTYLNSILQAHQPAAVGLQKQCPGARRCAGAVCASPAGAAGGAAAIPGHGAAPDLAPVTVSMCMVACSTTPCSSAPQLQWIVRGRAETALWSTVQQTLHAWEQGQSSAALLGARLLRRMEKLDIISEIRWGGEGGSGGQGQEGAGAEGDAQQEDAPDSGQLIYRFVLPDEVDTLSRLRSLRFYNCWFDELPEVRGCSGHMCANSDSTWRCMCAGQPSTALHA